MNTSYYFSEQFDVVMEGTLENLVNCGVTLEHDVNCVEEIIL